MIELFKLIENIQSKYSKKTFGIAILIVLGTSFILTRYFKFDKSLVHGVLLIFVCLLLVEIYLRNNASKLRDTNKTTLYKLYTLQEIMYNHIESQKMKNPDLTRQQIMEAKKRVKLDSLYLDANLIQFLDSITYLNKYNPDVYFLLLKSINNLLKLRNMIELYYAANGTLPENCYAIHEQVNNQIADSMNYMHSFIYTIPKTNTFYKQHSALQQRLFILLRRHSDFTKKACELKLKQEGRNNDTKVISRPEDPKGQLHVENTLQNSYDIYLG